MSCSLKSAGALVMVAALAGCGGGSAEHPCTAIGARTGVGLEIAPPLAARTAKAVLKICWDGDCRSRRLQLNDSTRSVPQGCTGGAPDGGCGAVAVRTGGKNGFADLSSLPKRPVNVTVTLSDAGERRLLRRRIDVTPKAAFPNGPDCGEGGPQVALVVQGDQLRVRA
jgi:hypothetical protein